MYGAPCRILLFLEVPKLFVWAGRKTTQSQHFFANVKWDFRVTPENDALYQKKTIYMSSSYSNQFYTFSKVNTRIRRKLRPISFVGI